MKITNIWDRPNSELKRLCTVMLFVVRKMFFNIFTQLYTLARRVLFILKYDLVSRAIMTS